MTPPDQIGPYRIVRPLGEGGMGAVFEAVQEPIGRRVAIKVLLPQYAKDRDAVSRFFNEARAVNLIEHPSIVQISDYGQVPDGTAYLVMEFLRGETLEGRLEALQGRGVPMPMVEALQIAAQLADGIAAAHDNAVIHRDLKPSNIMLVSDAAVLGSMRAKILDFGIAKLVQGQGKGTATNAVIGTPQYMSPEQCAGAGRVDDRTDVYALGVMLFEMLAGELPFTAETPLEYMGQHAFKQPPALRERAPGVLPELAELVQRLLVKDKQSRPSMREVGVELGQLLMRITSASPEAVRVADRVAGAPEPPVLASAARPRSPSTLGGSLGQTLRPVWGPRSLPLVAGGVVVGVMVVVMVGFFGTAPRSSSPAPLSGTVTSQSPSRAPAPPASAARAGQAVAPESATLTPSAQSQPAFVSPPSTQPLSTASSAAKRSKSPYVAPAAKTAPLSRPGASVKLSTRPPAPPKPTLKFID